MSRIYTVAIVGGGIGRSHIVEGYATNKDKFRVIAICDLDAKRRKMPQRRPATAAPR